MQDKTIEYLNEICSHIKCRAVHQEIQEEMRSHIEELSEEYIEQGYDREKAVECAITAMGNSEEIGQRLNQLHKPQTEWALIGIVSAIALIGGMVLYTGTQVDTLQVVQFERYIMYALAGAAMMVGLYFFDYTKLAALSKPLYITAILLSVLSKIKGINVDGMNYISLNSLTISSEYITFIFLISFAGIAEESHKRKERIKFSAFVIFSIALIMIIAGVSQAILLTTGCAVLYLSVKSKGNRIRKPSKGMTVCALGIIFILVYKLTHISFETINYASTTDYVFLNLVSSLGMAAGIVFLILTVAFIARMFQTIHKIKNSYGYYLSMVSGTALAAQFGIHILMNLNLLPAMNINLPFVSYGGTGYITSMALVGIILSVWRRNNTLGYLPMTEKGGEEAC